MSGNRARKNVGRQGDSDSIKGFNVKEGNKHRGDNDSGAHSRNARTDSSTETGYNTYN